MDGGVQPILRRRPFSGRLIQGDVCGIGLTMEMVEQIDRLGFDYPVRPLPKNVRRRERGQCYLNASALAARRCKEFTYVQGLALLEDDGIWRGHGWCIDAEGYVVDNTWVPAGLRYVGIPVPPEFRKGRWPPAMPPGYQK